MNILLGISGSIASYKSYDVARQLVKNGHSVKVILTTGALEFIKAETFRYIGVEEVYLPTDDFAPSRLRERATVLHIDLVKWADKLVIAPASANTISRMATGITKRSSYKCLPRLRQKTGSHFSGHEHRHVDECTHSGTQDEA